MKTMSKPRLKSLGVTSRIDDGDREVWLINTRSNNQRNKVMRNQELPLRTLNAPRWKPPRVTGRRDDGDQDVRLINARRTIICAVMMGKQVITPRRRVRTPTMKQIHHKIITHCEKRGRSNGLSENQCGKGYPSKMDRKGGIRNNKYGEDDTRIETLPALVKKIIFRRHRKRLHFSQLSAQQGKFRVEQRS